jgi:hypothetical protein
MAVYTTMEYVMPTLNNNRTATRQLCFVRDRAEMFLSSGVSELVGEFVSQWVGE